MSKTVRFDTDNIVVHEIPATDRHMKHELFYSRRDIESFTALHYMEEMIGLLAFSSEVPKQDPLVSLIMGFGSDERNLAAAKEHQRRMRQNQGASAGAPQQKKGRAYTGISV
jgi:hypothetical protein